MMFNFRRKEVPWEIVDSKGIEPVPTHYDDEEEDLDITAISESDAHGTYLFEARDVKQKVDVGRAVGFARQELLKQLASKGFNAFLTESWNVTHLRRGKQHRVEVQYSGRRMSLRLFSEIWP
ncbi:hypothetical protein AX16_005521 [Volvariella volvacea WC 439]|nr:hypothetical protein AX16_005521 [Volvariella volvacea WC 439]